MAEKYTKVIEIIKKATDPDAEDYGRDDRNEVLRKSGDGTVVIVGDDTDKELKEIAESFFDNFLTLAKREFPGNKDIRTLRYMGVNGSKNTLEEKTKVINVIFNEFKKIRDQLNVKVTVEEATSTSAVRISLNAQILQESRDALKSLKDINGIANIGRREELLKDFFELNKNTNEPQVVVHYKINGYTETKTYPLSVVQKILGRDSLKGQYKILKSKKGDDVYVLEEKAKKALINETEKFFQDWYINETLEKYQRKVERYKEKVAKEQEELSNPWAVDYIKNHQGLSVDEYLEILRKHLKDEFRRKSREVTNAARKNAHEINDVVRRMAQKANRSHYRALTFNKTINISEPPSLDKLIDEVIEKARKELNNTVKKLAIIGTSQRVVDSENIHKPSENVMFTEYNQVKKYDKDANGKNISVNTNKFSRTTKSVPKKDVKKRIDSWYKTTFNMYLVDTTEFVEEEDFKIVGILKPAYVNQDTATWTERISGGKVKHEVDFGCLLAATYFYTLVSNTPIDEEYRMRKSDGSNGGPVTKGEKLNHWSRYRFGVKKDKSNHSTGAPNKTTAEMWREINKAENRSHITSTTYRERVHKPDNESVRGDWVMTFRGVTFKAFDSEPASNSESVMAQYTFKEEDFVNPITSSVISDISKVYSKTGKIRNTVTKPYIWNIAEQIAKVVPNTPDDIKVEVHNINPRWQILEYGGYTSDQNGPYKGSGKYGVLHGVTSEGFSYQAPRGFKRIVDAQYNAILTTNANRLKQDYGNASAYTRGNRALKWNIDISKMDQPQFENLMKELEQEDGTLAMDKIHTLDGNKVWKWEPIK